MKILKALKTLSLSILAVVAFLTPAAVSIYLGILTLNNYDWFWAILVFGVCGIISYGLYGLYSITMLIIVFYVCHKAVEKLFETILENPTLRMINGELHVDYHDLRDGFHPVPVTRFIKHSLGLQIDETATIETREDFMEYVEIYKKERERKKKD
jgi:hypothetical protein